MRDLVIKEDKTIRISYSALVTVVSGIVAFAAWMTTLQLTATSNSSAISEIQSDSKEMQKVVVGIDKKLATIEAILKSQSRRRGE